MTTKHELTDEYIRSIAEAEALDVTEHENGLRYTFGEHTVLHFARAVEREVTAHLASQSQAAPEPVTRLDVMNLIRMQCHRVYASAIDREDIDTKYMAEIEAAVRVLASPPNAAEAQAEQAYKLFCQALGNLALYDHKTAEEIGIKYRDLSASPASAQMPDAAMGEELVRFCPHCASIGEIGAEYRDCCPDGSAARRIPKKLAEVCRDTFKLAIGNVAAPASPPATVAPELRNAFVTLESSGGEGRTIVLKFNRREDAYAVHDFLLKAGGKDYWSSAATVAQGEQADRWMRDALALCDHLIHTKGDMARALACNLRPKIEQAMLAAPTTTPAQAVAEEVRNIGAQMANVMFNLAQHPAEPLTGDVVATMDSLRKQWEFAVRKLKPAGDTGAAEAGGQNV